MSSYCPRAAQDGDDAPTSGNIQAVGASASTAAASLLDEAQAQAESALGSLKDNASAAITDAAQRVEEAVASIASADASKDVAEQGAEAPEAAPAGPDAAADGDQSGTARGKSGNLLLRVVSFGILGRGNRAASATPGALDTKDISAEVSC